MGFSVIRKEAGSNTVLNPIAGDDNSLYGSQGGISVTVVTTQARFGLFSYRVPIVGNNDGMDLDLDTLANAIHFVSVYVHGTPANTLQASLDGATFSDLVLLNGLGDDTGWSRYGVQIPAAQANGSTSVDIEQDGAGVGTLFFDGIQVEEKTYPTTMIHGDLGKGYRWAGLKHASVSSRKDDVRDGGRELTFKANDTDTADINMVIADSGTAGLGMTSIVNNVLPFALQPGAAFQNAKLLSRIIELEAMIFDASISTFDEMLAEKKLVTNLWKPDAGSPGQVTPFIHDPVGINRKLFLDTYYESGLEIVGGLESNQEEFTLRLLSVSPFWYEDDSQRATLDFQDTNGDADYVMGRIDGTWTALGSGMSAATHALAYDIERGRVYMGGAFATADGVTVNGITYFDIAADTFIAMGGTPGVSGATATVTSITVAPNGDVWIGGEFTSAGGSTSDGLAKWDVSADSWVQFTNGVANDIINAIAIDSTGIIYIGGDFLNWDGDPDADRIAQSTDGGVNWTSLGAGMNNIVHALALDDSDNLYVGGEFTTADGVTVNRFTKWDQSAFTALGDGVDGNVHALSFGKDGTLYLGGAFSDEGNGIAAWTGTDYETLGSGVSGGNIFDLYFSMSGDLLVAGSFTQAGGITLADRFAGWNGSSWFHWDIDLPGSPTSRGILEIDNGDIYIGYTTAGTATIAGLTTVDYGGTATVSPVITIFGPTTADTTAILQWLENQTTGTRLYFNMSIQDGEIITINTRPGNIGITSNFRGTIFDNPLDPGGLSLFNLLPGENIIAAFITDTITGVEMFMDSQLVHHGIEGVAV